MRDALDVLTQETIHTGMDVVFVNALHRASGRPEDQVYVYFVFVFLTPAADLQW